MRPCYDLHIKKIAESIATVVTIMKIIERINKIPDQK
jgi:hypothetical protein